MRSIALEGHSESNALAIPFERLPKGKECRDAARGQNEPANRKLVEAARNGNSRDVVSGLPCGSRLGCRSIGGTDSTLSWNDEGHPAFRPLTCGHCGYVVLFDGKIAGID
jgi:hypothetical protein